jgi:hypothetical protein
MLDAMNCFLDMEPRCWSSHVDASTLRRVRVVASIASPCSLQADLEACAALPPPNSPGGCPLDTLRDTMECADQLNLDASFTLYKLGSTVCTKLKLFDTCLNGLSQACRAAHAGALQSACRAA